MDFETTKDLFLMDLAGRSLGVLATADGGRVTARAMSLVVLGGSVWFQTDRRMEKAAQMRANPRVALAMESYSLEGVARERGRWEDHPAVLEGYLRFHRGSYLRYGNLDNERVYEVVLTRIRKWEYVEGQPLERILDLENGTLEVREFNLA